LFTLAAYNDSNNERGVTAMKHKRVLIGTILLFGNLAFAVELERAGVERETETVLFDHSVQSVVETLRAKGLEPETAQRKAEGLFGAERAFSSRRIDVFVAAFPELPSGSITDYLAECALHGRHVDLCSYDALVRMMQSVSRKVPGGNEYDRVRRVAEANGRIGATVAV
jgi:hypothetical protein